MTTATYKRRWSPDSDVPFATETGNLRREPTDLVRQYADLVAAEPAPTDMDEEAAA